MNKEVVSNADDLGIGLAKLNTESLSVLATLRKNLKIKMIWARGFSLLFFIGFIFTDANTRYWLLALFIAYELLIYLVRREMKSVKDDLDYAGVTKEILTTQIKVIKKILKMERNWGYVMIPLACPIGFIAFKSAKGIPASELFTDPKMLAIILGLMLFATLLINLAERANKVAFGRYLDKLEAQLEQMKG